MEQENKIETAKKVHYGWLIALAVIIIIQSVYVAVHFFQPDQRHFLDCYFRYSLSNSYYKPFMSSEIGWMGTFSTSGEEINQLLMPTEATRFKYDSVWYNQECDVNPPLFYVVLHTICSFFPGKFSWWYGLSINIICFAVMQFFIFKLVNLLCKSPVPALVTNAFWGFTVCSQNSMELIGMYLMLMMFSMILAYIAVKCSQTDKLTIKKNLIPVLAIVFCGSMTQHVFLIYAFFLTLFICINFLLHKKVYNCFSYGIASTIGVGLSFAAFPATISHIFGENVSGGVFSPLTFSRQPDFKQNVGLFSKIIMGEMFGAYSSMFDGYGHIYVRVVLIVLLILFLAFCGLCRNETWFKAAVSTVINGIKQFWKSDMFIIVVLALAVAGTFCFECTQLYFWDIGTSSTRYILLVVPIIAVVIAVTVYNIIVNIKPKTIRIALYGIVCALLVCSGIIMNFIVPEETHYYLISNNNTNGSVDEYVSGENCLIMLKDNFVFTNLLGYLINSNDIFVTSYYQHSDNYTKHFEDIDKFTDRDHFYIIVDDFPETYGNSLDEISDIMEIEGYNVENDAGYDKESGLFINQLAVKEIEEHTHYKATLVTEQDLDYMLTVSLYRMDREE